MFFTSLSSIRMTDRRSLSPDFMAAFMSSVRRWRKSIIYSGLGIGYDGHSTEGQSASHPSVSCSPFVQHEGSDSPDVRPSGPPRFAAGLERRFCEARSTNRAPLQRPTRDTRDRTKDTAQAERATRALGPH